MVRAVIAPASSGRNARPPGAAERLEDDRRDRGPTTLRLGRRASCARARIRASVLVSIEPRSQPGILARLKSIAEVERIHTISGRVDLLLEVGAPTTAALDAVLERIGEIEGVRSSESLIHLSTRNWIGSL